MVPAVKFFADYLTEKTGRCWMHAVSARPLGQARFAEYGEGNKQDSQECFYVFLRAHLSGLCLY